MNKVLLVVYIDQNWVDYSCHYKCVHQMVPLGR